MALSLPLCVKYKGKDDLLVESPVYDVLNFPLATEPIAGTVRFEIRTFFLVWETFQATKLMWIKKEDCDIVS